LESRGIPFVFCPPLLELAKQRPLDLPNESFPFCHRTQQHGGVAIAGTRLRVTVSVPGNLGNSVPPRMCPLGSRIWTPVPQTACGVSDTSGMNMGKARTRISSSLVDVAASRAASRATLEALKRLDTSPNDPPRPVILMDRVTSNLPQVVPTTPSSANG
jgi:hypothetical protein